MDVFRLIRSLLATVILSLVSFYGICQAVYPEKGFEKKKHVFTLDPDTIFFKNSPYLILPNGTVFSWDDNDTTLFKLISDLPIIDAFLIEIEDKILIFYEESDNLSSSCSLEAFDSDSLRRLYTAPLGGGGLSTPIIKGIYAYVSSFGFVAKLNLTNGDFVWKHDDLYDRVSFDFTFFKIPEFQGELVVFKSHNRLTDSTAEIIIKDISGDRIGKEIRTLYSFEIEDVVQRILDLPKLQQYYHAEIEGRLPIKLSEDHWINSDLRLTKFNQKVQILTPTELIQRGINDYISFDEIIYNYKILEFKISYKIEGVVAYGKYQKRDRGWSLLEYDLYEE